MNAPKIYGSSRAESQDRDGILSGQCHSRNYGGRAVGEPGHLHPHLTPRQLEVLALLCEGLPNKLICRRLGISAGTAKAHISSILREFGVTSRLQAVVEAGRCSVLSDQAAELSGVVMLTGDPLVMPFNVPESAGRGMLTYAYSRN